MMPRRLILLLLPPAYVLLSYYVVYVRLLVPRLEEWNGVPAWTWIGSIAVLAVLLLASGAFLALRARVAYALGLSLFLLGFQAWLAGRALGFLKLEPADVVAPQSLIFHAVLALVFFTLLSTTAWWRARSNVANRRNAGGGR